MREYRIIREEFEFLTDLYDFKIYFVQKHGSYCFVAWTNSKISIKVIYDATDTAPVSILTYDACSLGTIYDTTKYKDEFTTTAKKSRERIHCAAMWLKNAIKEETVLIE